MTFFQAFILGIIQGLTEFLPISSSAHLVLAPYFFGWQFPIEQVFPFDVLVQIGTLAAVIIYFWKDLLSIGRAFLSGLIQRQPFKEPHSRLGWYILLATLPAGVIGLLFDDLVEQAFHDPAITAFFLLITATLLVIAEKVGRRTRSLHELGWRDALWIGFAQALSIFPGISRSGATIAGAMTCNLQRREAARFSFLMSIPIMAAAGLLSLVKLAALPGLAQFLPVLAVGFITAAVVGYLSIHWLLAFLTRRSLNIFAIYCAGLGIVTLLITYVF